MNLPKMPVERCEEEDLKSMEAPQFQHTGFFINPSWHMFQSCTNFIDMFLAIRLWFNMRDTNIDGLECVDYTLSFSILVLNYSILYHAYLYIYINHDILSCIYILQVCGICCIPTCCPFFAHQERLSKTPKKRQ